MNLSQPHLEMGGDRPVVARRFTQAWLTLCAVVALVELGYGIHDLHSRWGVHHKDHLFHFAGVADLVAAGLLLCAVGTLWQALRGARHDARRLAIVAGVLTVVAVAACTTGLMVSGDAANICACDGA